MDSDQIDRILAICKEIKELIKEALYEESDEEYLDDEEDMIE